MHAFIHQLIQPSNHSPIGSSIYPFVCQSIHPFIPSLLYLSIYQYTIHLYVHAFFYPSNIIQHPPTHVSITCAVNFYIHYFFSTYWLFPTSICQYFQFLFINRFSIVQSINTSFYAVKAGRPFCRSRLWSLWWVLNCMGSSTEPLHVSHSVFMFCWGSLCSAWMNMSKLSSYPSGRNPYLKLVSLQCSTKRLWIKHSWA